MLARSYDIKLLSNDLFLECKCSFELTSLIDRCYLDLVIKNTLENRIGVFVDSLNRQRKDSVRVEKLEIQRACFVKLLVKAFMFYLTLNKKAYGWLDTLFYSIFLSSCLNSLFRLQCICFLIDN
jgi:hypothetical protein